MFYQSKFPPTSVTVCCLTVMALTCGCHRAFPKFVSTISVADPFTAHQLLSGFYGPEKKAWRWTARSFFVILAPPAGAEGRGAKVQLRMHISPSQIDTLGPMTLRVRAGGYPLAPRSFSSSGNCVYSADVPQNALTSCRSNSHSTKQQGLDQRGPANSPW